MAEFSTIRPGSLIGLHLRRGEVQLSRGRTAFVCSHDGLVHDDPHHGLFVYQTRVLGKYRWLMDGLEPEFSCASKIDQHSWMGYYIQAPAKFKGSRKESTRLQHTVELRLKRWVGEGMHEEIQLTNHTQGATKLELELDFQPQFLAPEEAIGKRRQHGKLSARRRRTSPGWQLDFNYVASHHYRHQGNVGNAEFRRGLTLFVAHADSKPVNSGHRLRFRVQLKPHGVWRCCLDWASRVDDVPLPLPAKCHSRQMTEYDRKFSKYLSETTSIECTSNDLRSVVEEAVHRAKLDLCAMRLFDQEKNNYVTLAAGIPTYMGIFGRDLLASAWQASLLGPELAVGSLTALKKSQAVDVNNWRDAEPGRIVHEMHVDPLSLLNFRPKSRYYGSVSGAFLYPLLLSELWHWTGDLDLVRPYVRAAVRALRWADQYSLDETGFYRYQTKSEQGMKNQGWKDSGDAIVYPDGSQVPTPIGTCEMQAFAFAAKRHLSELLWWVGEHSAAVVLFEEAEALKQRFNQRFWMDREGTFAMGIDHKGDLIRSVASDPGHCLLSGIVDESRVKRLANRMLMPDMFSGWGVRTLSANHPAYNPFSYHRGSVWPVENGAFVLGFARYGLHGEMHALARALFEAAQLFPHCRLPELFAGHQRSHDAPFPGLYTRANWPQAWSASAVLGVMRALLGLFPYATANVLILDPRLPEWLPEIIVKNMRVGRARVTLHFERKPDGSTDYRITELEGKLHVAKQPSPWSLTTDWAERVKDALFSLTPGH